MKKILALLLAALLALALAGCGGTTEPPAPTEAPAESEGDGAEDEIAGLIEQVLALKGRPVQELYDAIGMPTGEA